MEINTSIAVVFIVLFVGLLFPKIEIQYKDTIKFQIIGLISLLIEKDWEWQHETKRNYKWPFWCKKVP